MARIRSIKPQFWIDEKLAPLAPIDRLVFLGLLSMADDAGRLVDNVKSIDGYLFSETEDSARASLATLAELGRIERYTTDSGQRCIQIVHWARHQRVDNPSKLPPLPAPPSTLPDAVTCAPSRAAPEALAIGSRESRDGAGAGSGEGVGVGKRDTEREEEHEEEAAPPENRSSALLLARFYHAAPPPRQADVARQLREVLSPAGVLFQGKRVFATPATLARAVEATIAKPPRDPAKAIVFVLLKLQQGVANETPPPGLAEPKPLGRAAPPVDAQQLAHARAFCEQHPDLWATKEREIVAQYGGAVGSHLGRSVLELHRQQAMLAVFHQASRSVQLAGAH